ncbi:MAG TPA: hypothetical protein VGD56_16790, partial [Gemmatirosa sp.]
AALPASTVVGLALWPETLAGWSRDRKLPSSVVWAVLAGAPSGPVRDMLARRLGVSMRELSALIDARRQESAASRAAANDDGAPGAPSDEEPPGSGEPRRAD